MTVQRSTWPVRLRFLVIGLAFAACWWAGTRAMSGRVSLAWASALAGQVSGLTGSLHLPSRQPMSTVYTVTQTPVARAQRVPSAAPRVGTTSIAHASLPTVRTGSVAPTASEGPIPTPAVAILAVTPVVTPEESAAAGGTHGVRSRATAGSESSVRATATPAGAVSGSASHSTYVVREGDTLFSIARRYGLTLSELAALNHLQPPYRIIKGSHLLLPAT